MKSLDESFWETAFTIHVPADSVTQDEVQQSKHTIMQTGSTSVNGSNKGNNSLHPSQQKETTSVNRSNRGSTNSAEKTRGREFCVLLPVLIG